MVRGRRIADRPDDWHDLLGMPTDWDFQNLTNLINQFKRETFEVYGKLMTGQQWISYEVRDARKEHRLELSEMNKSGMKVKEVELRVQTAIPIMLWNMIEAAYPTVFKDKEHYAWFIKKFPEFRIV